MPLILLAQVIAAALWRRWLGGWPRNFDTPHGRSLKWAAFLLLCWPLWFVLPWWGALLVSGALSILYSVRHDNFGDSMAYTVLRYPGAGIFVGMLRRFQDRLPPLPFDLAAGTRWTAYGELVIGAFYLGPLPLLLLVR